MSPQILDNQTLRRIYDEILEEMKRQGIYDNIRMQLVQPIFDDPSFQDIVKEYTRECERFCETADLSKQRNELRISLAARIEANSRTGRAITNHIKDLLDKHKSSLREEFNKHATAYIRRFREDEQAKKAEEEERLAATSIKANEEKAKSDPSADGVKSDAGEEDMDIDSPPITSPLQKSPTPPPMSPITNLLQTSPISSLGSNKSSPKQISMDLENGELDDINIPEAPPYSPVNATDTNHNDNHEEQSNPSPPPVESITNEIEDDDELAQLTFSEVSSVHTCDLSDFEDEINLSDDNEAVLVGKPKNSKVDFKELESITQDQKTKCPPENNDRTKKVKREEAEATAPLAQNSHESKEVSSRRTRKSNPRYSNNDYFTSKML